MRRVIATVALLAAHLGTAGAAVINVPGDYSTIQAAINAAAPGDMIQVAAGTYNENLTVAKALALVGPNAWTDPVTGSRVAEAVINGGGGTAVIPQVDNITVNGFTISTLDGGFPIYTGGTDVSGLQVMFNIIGTGVRAVTIASQAPGGVKILHNKITGAGYGIHFGNGTYGNVKINNNEINGPVGYYAIYTHGSATMAGFELKDNQVHDICNIASNITNGVVSGNTFDTDYPGYYTIAIDLHAASTVTGNTFIGHGTTGGLVLWGTQYGLVPSADTTINGNTFSSCSTFGIKLSPGVQQITIPAGSNDFGTAPNPIERAAHLLSAPDVYYGLQAAIDAASAGDSVGALPGTYAENITVTETVHLIGAGATTIIYPAYSDVGSPDPDAGPSFRGSQVIVVEADNVEIANLVVDGDNPGLTSGVLRNGADIDARNGIIENYNIGIWDNLVVHDCTIRNIYLRGLYASSGGDGFHFYDNTVDNVAGGPSSIAIFNFGGAGIVENNTVTVANDAIAANWSRGTQFLNNIVTESGSGVHTDNNGGYGGVADLIQGNQVSNAASNGYGVWVFFPYLNTVLNENTVTNADAGLFAWGGSGGVGQFTNNTVDGQNRAGCIGTYVTTGLLAWTWVADVAATFTGNAVTNCAYGVYVEEEPGFEAMVVLHDNNLAGNTPPTLSNAGTHTVDASGNWWGDNNPAAVAGKISGLVDYTPWLDLPTDTGDPGFQGDFSTLWVDDDSPQTGSEGRIAEALGLVTGSTVYVAPGTYAPTVVLDDSTVDGIVLQGSNPADRPQLTGGVLLDNDTDPLDGITLKDLILKGDADPSGDESIVSMRNGAAVNDLTMDHCVLDGEGVVVGSEGGNGRFGLQGNMLGGTFTVMDCVFRDIAGWSVADMDTSFGGPPIGGNALVLTAVTFTRNTIEDCNGTVGLRGNHANRTDTVDVHGNTWTHIGGNFGQTGMQWAAVEINHADALSFYNNTIDGVVLGFYGEGQALQMWDIGALDMHDNVITDNAQGVFLFGGGAGHPFGGPYAVPSGSVYDNTIAGNTAYGLSVDPANTGGPLDAENNNWGFGEGPLDSAGTYEVSAGDCGTDPAAALNVAPPGALGNAVSENVDYCPWTIDAMLTLRPQDGGTCYKPGDTLVVEVYLSNVATANNIIGGDFFLDYDETKLQLANDPNDMSVRPGDSPFTAEISECSTDHARPGCSPTAGLIDYSVGVPYGDLGTKANTVMARITFLVLTGTNDCDVAGLFTFRPHDPPTKLSDYYANPVYPGTIALEPLGIDSAAPGIAGTVNSGSLNATCGATVPVSIVVTDNCGVLMADVDFDAATSSGSLDYTGVTAVQTNATTVTISGSAILTGVTACSATVTFNVDAHDCPENYSTFTTSGTWSDTTDPTFVGFPGNRGQNADPNLCTAVLVPAIVPPTGADNCDSAVQIDYKRSDEANWNEGLNELYPVGTTTITWRATDNCTNVFEQDQTVTIAGVNDIVITLDIDSLLAAPVDRCITFEVWECGTPKVSVPTVVHFTPGGTHATGTTTIQVPCGDAYTCITARDKLHALRRKVDLGTGGSPPQYTAVFAYNADPALSKMLLSGNLNDDAWVDILDFGVFSWQFMKPSTADTTCSTAYPHADLTGDGAVNAGDFSPIFTNYLMGREANCCDQPGFREDETGPITRISVADLVAQGLGELAAGDINGDGWLDEQDMAEFAAGLPPAVQVGDLNCDGAVNFADINPFVMALSNPAAWQQAYPDCNLLNADVNDDGAVDLGDINAFIALLGG